jgi:hypothetical protein
MNFDQLGPSWREGSETAAVAATAAKSRLERQVKTARTAERFAALIFRRDMIETGAAILVIYVFGSTLLDRAALARFELPVAAALGLAVNILGAVFIVYHLHRTRRSTPAPRLVAPVREFLTDEIVRTEKQIGLLSSVAWWYLAPFYLGVNLFFFSVEGFCAEFVVGGIVVTALFWVIYRMNRLVASGTLTLLRDRLVWERDQLDLDEESTAAPPDPASFDPTIRRFAFKAFGFLLAIGVGCVVVLWAWDTIRELAKPERPKPATIPINTRFAPEVLERYAGKYELTPGAVLTVTPRDSRLDVGLTGQPTWPVFPRSEAEWFYIVVEATLTFRVNDRGECTAVELFQNGVCQVAQRVE